MATQPKISSFFKPTVPIQQKSSDPYPSSHDIYVPDAHKSTADPEIAVTYERKISKLHGRNSKLAIEYESTEELPKLEQSKSNEVLSKKYAADEEGDERFHKTVHKNYTHGVPFKGWRHERIIDALERGRIILVQDGDPPSQENKVQDVVQVMEMELGDGWILHKHCKVYMFISSQRVGGCLVVEPITEAYRILPSSVGEKYSYLSAKEKRKSPTALQFGNISLPREIIRRDFVESPKEEINGRGAILCEDKALPEPFQQEEAHS